MGSITTLSLLATARTSLIIVSLTGSSSVLRGAKNASSCWEAETADGAPSGVAHWGPPVLLVIVVAILLLLARCCQLYLQGLFYQQARVTTFEWWRTGVFCCLKMVCSTFNPLWDSVSTECTSVRTREADPRLESNLYSVISSRCIGLSAITVCDCDSDYDSDYDSDCDSVYDSDCDNCSDITVIQQ